MSLSDAKDWISVVGIFVTIAIQLRTQFNVKKVEIATNSMKDALVKATGEAAGLAGEARGRAQAAEARTKE
jgi:hypothetical protein